MSLAFGGVGSQSLFPLPDDPRRKSNTGGFLLVSNLLITTLALANTLARPPVYSQKQDLANKRLHVSATYTANRLPLTSVAVTAPFKPVLFQAPQQPRFIPATTPYRNVALLTGVVAASPFIPDLSDGVQRARFLPLDTSHGTPKTLFEDVSFAPSQSEFQTISWPKRLGADTSFRNTAILSQPVASPFVPKSFDNVQWRNWLPLDTSRGSPTSLLNPTPFWGSPQVSAPVFPRTLSDTSQSSPPALFVQPAPPFLGYVPPNLPPYEYNLPDTSQGTPKALTAQPFTPVEDVFVPLFRNVVDTSQGSPLVLLTTPVQTPFWNDNYNVIRPPFNVTDTSRGTPLALLTAPVFPPFYQNDFPSPIEFRFEYWPTNDPQIYPEFIPPAPPPVIRTEIDGGVPRKKHKHPRKEIEELVETTIQALQKAPEPVADLPEPLKPVARVIQVPAYSPPIDVIPLESVPGKPDDEDDDDLTAAILFGLI